MGLFTKKQKQGPFTHTITADSLDEKEDGGIGFDTESVYGTESAHVGATPIPGAYAEPEPPKVTLVGFSVVDDLLEASFMVGNNTGTVVPLSLDSPKCPPGVLFAVELIRAELEDLGPGLSVLVQDVKAEVADALSVLANQHRDAAGDLSNLRDDLLYGE